MWKWPIGTLFDGTWRGLTGPDGKTAWHDKDSPGKWTSEERAQWGVTWAAEVVEQPTIEQVKAAKLARIRAARHAVEFGGTMHDGVMYDSDATARAKYGETRDVFALMPDMVVEGWKASDGPDGLGTYVTMTKALLDALTMAGAAHDKACFDWERGRQAEVAAAVADGDMEALVAISETM